MLSYECDPSAVFDDSSLPSGLCDDLASFIAPCASNIATAWAVGGDYVSSDTGQKNFLVSTVHGFRIDC
jgi:hypothetical protein